MDPEPSDKIIGARALRKLGNKGTNEFVIKCGLIKSLGLDSAFRKGSGTHLESHDSFISVRTYL